MNVNELTYVYDVVVNNHHACCAAERSAASRRKQVDSQALALYTMLLDSTKGTVDKPLFIKLRRLCSIGHGMHSYKGCVEAATDAVLEDFMDRELFIDFNLEEV